MTDRNDPDTGKAPSTEVVPASRELVQRAQGPAFIPDWVPSRLPFAGPVTTVTKTVTGLARPFLPTTIVRTVGRTIQTFVEEEEINFTITRKRHVTVEEKTVTEQPVAHGETGRRSALSAGSPSNGQASYHVPSSRVHDAPSAVQGPATRSITGADIVGDLPEWPSLRGLPPAE